MLTRISKTHRIRLFFLFGFVLTLMFHNCGNVNLSQKPSTVASGNNGGMGEGVGAEVTPPAAVINLKTKAVHFCAPVLEGSDLHYYDYKLDIETKNFSDAVPVGNCVMNLTEDIDGDNSDEYIHNFGNSTIYGCKAEIRDGVTGALKASQTLSGNSPIAGNKFVCSGTLYPISDQDKDGKKDLYYIYVLFDSTGHLTQKVQILKGTNASEIKHFDSTSQIQASIFSIVSDSNGDGLEDFLASGAGSFFPDGSYHDGKIALLNGADLWGSPIKTTTLDTNQMLEGVRVLKNKNGPDKWLAHIGVYSVNTQKSIIPIGNIIALYDHNLARVSSISNAVVAGGSALGLGGGHKNDVADVNGDGLDDVLLQQVLAPYTYQAVVVDGTDLHTLQIMDAAWLSQKTGKSISGFMRVVGLSDVDNSGKASALILVWTGGQAQMLAIKVDGTVVWMLPSPSDWITELYTVKTP